MWSASDLDLIARAFPSHVVNILGRLEQRILQSGETKEEVIAEIRAGYERSLLDDEHIPPPPRDELQEQIDLIRWVIGAESLLHFSIDREGGNASDTLANDAGLFQVALEIV